MLDIDTIVDDLMNHEGFCAEPYQDTNGVWTVGYGWNLECTPMTQEAAEFVLREQAIEAIADAERYRWFHDLSHNRKRVVINMIFNLGRTGFRRFKKTIAFIDRSDYEAAAAEMLDSLWARQVGHRATFLSELMAMG